MKTAEARVAECLERIQAREPEIRAWAYVDPEHALAQARALDRMPPRGPLHGVPIGIKDVLDTHDMPTEYGSSVYKGFRPKEDSNIVAALRRAGAVILGKTRTTEFASPIPVGVRNPLDFTRTPGVSSSGSAAAVADGMVPIALGTQTGGSIIRPATYCGIYGYKASLDAMDRGGIRHLRPTLDTLGVLARSLDDIALVQGSELVRSTANRVSASAAPTNGRSPSPRPSRPYFKPPRSSAPRKSSSPRSSPTRSNRSASSSFARAPWPTPPSFATISTP